MTETLEAKLCAICQKAMYEKEVKGILIDVCDLHGVWLDRGELNHLLHEFKQEGFSDSFALGVRKVMRGINY